MASPWLTQEEFDKLPTGTLKSEYRPGTAEEGLEGKHVLKVDVREGWGLENVAGLKNTVSTTRADLKKLKDRVAGYGEDMTPDKLSEVLAELETLRKSAGEGGDKKSAAAIEAMKKQLTEKHTKELNDRDTLIKQRDRELEEVLIDSALTNAMTAAGVRPGAIEFAVPKFRGHCKIERDARGKPTVIVLNDPNDPNSGAKMSMKSGQTGNMGIDELVGGLKGKKEYAFMFDGTPASGTGATKPGKKTPTTTAQPSNNDHHNAPPSNPGADSGFSAALKAERRAQWEANRK